MKMKTGNEIESKGSITFCRVNLWDCLPQDARDAESLPGSKKRLNYTSSRALDCQSPRYFFKWVKLEGTFSWLPFPIIFLVIPLSMDDLARALGSVT